MATGSVKLSESPRLVHRYGNRCTLPLVAVGLGAGFIGGLLGIGGGVLIVPCMVLLLNFSQHLAQGTSLAALLMMSLSGIATYLLCGHGNLLLGAQMGAGGIFGALLGARIAHAVRGRSLRIAFSLVLVYIGIRMICRSEATAACVESGCHNAPSLLAWAPVLFGIGFVAGTMGSILGVAGGFITTPALVILLNLNQQSAQALSFIAMPFALSVGVAAYRKQKSVDLSSALRIGIAGALGVYIGGRLACSMSSSGLRLVFGIALLIISFALALKKQPSATEYTS